MQPYRASNRAPLNSVILLFIVAFVAGAVSGGILFAIEYFTSFYLIIAFPLLAGVLAGAALAQVIRVGHVRSPILAILTGLLSGVVIYGVYHFASYYIGFRNEVRNTLIEQGQPLANDAELDEFVDFFLQDEVGDTGFMGFMRLTADQGFSITRATSSTDSSGIPIQGTIAWAYWGVEILVTAITAAGTAAQAARQPFDENSRQWYGGPETIGVALNKSRKDLLNALKNGSFTEAGRLMTRQDIKYPRIEIATRRSPDPTARDVMLMVYYVQRKGRANELKRGIISSAQLDSLTRAIADEQRISAPAARR